jgi:hypothetical protein
MFVQNRAGDAVSSESETVSYFTEKLSGDIDFLSNGDAMIFVGVAFTFVFH